MNSDKDRTFSQEGYSSENDPVNNRENNNLNDILDEDDGIQEEDKPQPFPSIAAQNSDTTKTSPDKPHTRQGREDSKDRSLTPYSSSDSAFDSSSNDDSRSNKNDDFMMKNGCCRECMKAFSKNGKVSAVRKILLWHLELSLLSAEVVKTINFALSRMQVLWLQWVQPYRYPER